MKNAFVLFVMFIMVICQIEAKQTEEELIVISIHASSANNSDLRSQSVSADLTGHTLTIEFNENIGKARITITNMLGINVECETIYSTPNCVVFTISNADFYRIEIVTSNGEQYFGNFRIEN